ncbi:N-6 DNA Methylase family [Coleofasciculus chthonoplastes PCC 7420]|uniref:site-specific DNA-methyltransferase (adenine-specific) n=1 Tax=Coleofasciculus chthonoplastes PCC 7420 TaxID=118168 RepID=B4VZI1_9CYAN|nr:N-6 DNA methylase [Coleofasciculus chthonoplastes]EDX72671.1 N-6 DNA Methylase family [Coleofasciculus chthonoplastes PCC 7420]
MTSVNEKLNQVWSELRKTGITDDLTVIEYLARLLLEESGAIVAVADHSQIPSIVPNETEDFVSEKGIPKRLPRDLNVNIEAIKQYLRQAAEQAGDMATLFDRYVLFRLPSMLPGGRYPTPRHIVKFMQRLAQLEPNNHSVADLACGSGGFLLDREITNPSSSEVTIGIDISPEWKRLAWANTRLHHFTPRLINGNALQVCGSEEFTKKTFDRILINPPFGEKIDEKLAENTLGYKVSSRSETALTALALQKLAPAGKAAILVPSGLLFSNNTSERKLRRQLIFDYKLEAVISLPKDALQPYSPLQTHLLLVSKPDNFAQPSKNGENLIWFWQLEQDGYPSGRGRDLTQDPDESASDLPFVTRVLTNPNSPLLFPQQNPRIAISRIVEGTSLLGFVCQATSTELTSVTFYPQPNETTSAFLLTKTAPLGKQRICDRIPLDGSEPSQVENPQQLIKELYGKKDPDPKRLFSQPVKAAAISVLPESQALGSNRVKLLGVAVRCDTIQAPTYDLRPERYVEKQEEPRSTDSPAELLSQIYQNQRKLSQHIENLFGRLELPAIANQQLPSPLANIASLGILEKLNPEQKTIWERIQAKIEKIDSRDQDNPQTAVHFTLEELLQEDDSEISEMTRSTVDLLERLGVIVPVTITTPSTDESIQCYRRVTERDLWQFD